jgi:hypothetical protein
MYGVNRSMHRLVTPVSVTGRSLQYPDHPTPVGPSRSRKNGAPFSSGGSVSGIRHRPSRRVRAMIDFLLAVERRIRSRIPGRHARHGAGILGGRKSVPTIAKYVPSMSVDDGNTGSIPPQTAADAARFTEPTMGPP